MAAEAEVDSTVRCNRCGDAGQQQQQHRIIVTRTDEQTGYPHRVRDLVMLLVV